MRLEDVLLSTDFTKVWLELEFTLADRMLQPAVARVICARVYVP